MSKIFPVCFMLHEAMNTCPCGFYNHPEKDCVCGPGIVQKYLNKISGPLHDRIDIHVEVTPVPFSELSKERISEKSEMVRARVVKARSIQAERFKESENVFCNSQMSAKQLRTICALSQECNQLLKIAVERIGLSARAYDRILKVARTIADLGGSTNIESEHIAEAIQYRNLDRDGWAG